MREDNQIILRPENPNDPEGLLKKIIDTVNELIPDAGESAGNILKGIGQQKLAKASEIKAKAYKDIAEIQLANQKLIIERDQKFEQLKLQQELNNKEHEARMYALKTERLKALSDVVVATKGLIDLGCEIDLTILVKSLMGSPEASPKKRTNKQITNTTRNPEIKNTSTSGSS